MTKSNYISRFFKSIASAFARTGNTNFKFRFGKLRAVISEGRSISMRNGKLCMDNNFFFWKKGRGDFHICPNEEPNPHIVISGMSGFGKSTLFKSLLQDIRKMGISCIVFDAHNEHANMVRNLGGDVHNAIYSGINILELDGASVSERISEITRVFKSVYSLGYIQATKLSECLWYTYRKSGARSRYERSIPVIPTVKDLIDELSIFIRNSKGVGERNTLTHLRDRLSLLNSSAFTGSMMNVSEIRTGLHSFSLANMKSKEAQVIYIGELLNRLYAGMHDGSKPNSPRLYVMVDEAQFLIDSSNNDPIIAKLIEEGRKYGVGVIIVTHAASSLNKRIMANCSTFVTFYAREPTETSYISKVLSGGNSDMVDAIKRKLSTLNENHAILVSGVFRKPVLIVTPTFNEVALDNAKRVSESEVIDWLKVMARKPVRLEELERALHVNNDIIQSLTSSGLVDRFSIRIDNRIESWIMLHKRNISIEHEVNVGRISAMLSANGIRNRIVDNSNGPDIIVARDGRRLALEYETGSKSPESTRRMINSRTKNYCRIVIVTNDSVFWQYKSMFADSGIVVVPASNGVATINACKNF